jgi:hypothetical protein
MNRRPSSSLVRGLCLQVFSATYPTGRHSPDSVHPKSSIGAHLTRFFFVRLWSLLLLGDSLILLKSANNYSPLMRRQGSAYMDNKGNPPFPIPPRKWLTYSFWLNSARKTRKVLIRLYLRLNSKTLM